jgi:hypothetical protein
VKAPREETWRIERGVLVTGEGDDTTDVLYEKNLDCPWHIEHIQLAAQAPAMARLLIELAERDDDCPWCASPVAPTDLQNERARCAPTCELDQVLRSAGVRT